jgi:hypothetical protein
VTTSPTAASVRFAEVARRLGAAAHDVELQTPAFRCPPRVPGAVRTIRRFPGGTVVAVSIEGRPWSAVVQDMVEGVLVANRLDGRAAAQLRGALLAAASELPAGADGAAGARGGSHGSEPVIREAA